MISHLKINRITEKLLHERDFYRAPIDVFGLINRIGIELFEKPMEDCMSGFIKIEGAESLIVINKNHHVNRQRFTAAHELGHYCLHRLEEDEFQLFVDESFTNGIVDKRKHVSRRVFNRNSDSASGEYDIEIEANRFAAALLMPEKLIEDYVERWEIDITSDFDIKRLSKRFDVSTQSLSITSVGLRFDFL